MPFTDTSGVQIHYEVFGSKDQPPVVMIHGNGSRLTDWQHLGYVDRLAPHFYLILIDIRGCGDSDKLHDPAMYSADHIAADIIAVLDKLDIEKSHYFGNLLGGNIAFAVGRRYPDRFLSFIIGSAEPFGSKHEASAKFFVDSLSALQDFSEIDSEKIKKFIEDMEKWLQEPFPKGVREGFLVNDYRAWLALSQGQALWPDDSCCFQHSAVPRTLLYGELDNLVVNDNKLYAKIDPECNVVVVPNTTHAHAYWKSEIIAPHIIDILSQHIQLLEARQSSHRFASRS